jgi:homoserine trans-succinylase
MVSNGTPYRSGSNNDHVLGFRHTNSYDDLNIIYAASAAISYSHAFPHRSLPEK